MRLPEQFISFINFNIALCCVLVGIFLILANLSLPLYDFIFLYLKTSLKNVGLIFFSLGFSLFIGLRFQEGKKTIRMKSKNVLYEVDRKIIQDKVKHYFQSDRKLSYLTSTVKINKDQIIEINIQSSNALENADFDLWEQDLKKLFADMGYKSSFYINYTQPV